MRRFELVKAIPVRHETKRRHQYLAGQAMLEDRNNVSAVPPCSACSQEGCIAAAVSGQSAVRRLECASGRTPASRLFESMCRFTSMTFLGQTLWASCWLESTRHGVLDRSFQRAAITRVSLAQAQSNRMHFCGFPDIPAAEIEANCPDNPVGKLPKRNLTALTHRVDGTWVKANVRHAETAVTAKRLKRPKHAGLRKAARCHGQANILAIANRSMKRARSSQAGQ